MATDKFQLVGSLLRPQDLLDYKNQIEHREDIRYPFYDAFPGYQETEAKAIADIIAAQKNTASQSSQTANTAAQCGTWIFSGD